MEVAPHYTLFSLLTLLTLFTTTSVSPRRCIDVFWIYTGAMKVQEADNTQRPKGLCRALEGCSTGFLGGLRDVWQQLGLYWGLQAQMDGITPKMNQHQMLFRVYQNWLEFETSMRRDMVDTKLKILFTPGIFVGIVTILGTW